MNWNTTDNVLWPYEPDEESDYDEYDAADMMWAEDKLNNNQT